MHVIIQMFCLYVPFIIHDLTCTPSEVLKVLVIVSAARTWADVLVIPRGPGLAPELVVSNTLDKPNPNTNYFSTKCL